jgi:hypothetical protein
METDIVAKAPQDDNDTRDRLIKVFNDAFDEVFLSRGIKERDIADLRARAAEFANHLSFELRHPGFLDLDMRQDSIDAFVAMLDEIHVARLEPRPERQPSGSNN